MAEEREDVREPSGPDEESEYLESESDEASKGVTGDDVAAPFFERTEEPG